MGLCLHCEGSVVGEKGEVLIDVHVRGKTRRMCVCLWVLDRNGDLEYMSSPSAVTISSGQIFMTRQPRR